jgi:bacillithiol biosynthesis deacetylase BshB1
VDILAFSPHPDDVELGCGGSLLLAGNKGLRVAVADLSRGEQSSRGTPDERKKERIKATKLLGLCDRFLLGLPDSRIGTDPEHLLSVVKIIRETRPRIILAPYWKGRHPDHEATGRLVREAFFYAGVATVGTGRPYRPERLFYYMINYPFEPSFVVDISSVWQNKMKILSVYSSQFQWDGSGPQTAISQPEFIRFIETRAIWFGTMIGVDYGEPFLVSGPVPLHELPGVDITVKHEGELPPFSMFG